MTCFDGDCNIYQVIEGFTVGTEIIRLAFLKGHSGCFEEGG